MKVLIVGGNPDKRIPSSIINKLAKEFQTRDNSVSVCNAYIPETISGYNLVLWMPDIPNDHPKNYPVKDKGSVLICSKVMRKDTTEADAVTRIFKMHGNAVITINKRIPKVFEFKLIDALGNKWKKTSYISQLVKSLLKFYEWTDCQKRISFKRNSQSIPTNILQSYDIELDQKFIDLNTLIADKVESSLGTRFFGNFSTRCMKLFPSKRVDNNIFLFSPRNVDKKRITKDDFVLIDPPYFYGDRIYSVDAPCHIEIYKRYPDINYMIHGHAFLKYNEKASLTVPETENYYPCGDLREVKEITKLFDRGFRVINLKNHGFLIASKDLPTINDYIKEFAFNPPKLLK